MSETCPVCRSAVAPEDDRCRVCGFKLVGKTSRFTPVPSQPLDDLETRSTGEPSLRTIRGPQVGVVYPLEADVTSVGRDPGCTIFLNDMTVSREHARIRREGESFVIRDTGSFNGVWVNNKSIEAKALQDGDIVQIGSFAFIYEV